MNGARWNASNNNRRGWSSDVQNDRYKQVTSGNYGFLIGAVPGYAYFLWTMLWFRRVKKEAVALAWKKGEFLDMDSSENQNYDFLLRAGKFIKPGDGLGAREGKEHMLSARGRMLKRFRTGAILAVVGALIGVGVSTGIDLLMARP